MRRFLILVIISAIVINNESLAQTAPTVPAPYGSNPDCEQGQRSLNSFINGTQEILEQINQKEIDCVNHRLSNDLAAEEARCKAEADTKRDYQRKIVSQAKNSDYVLYERAGCKMDWHGFGN